MKVVSVELDRLGIETAEDVKSGLEAIKEAILRLEALYDKIDVAGAGILLAPDDTDLLRKTYELYLGSRDGSSEMSAVCARGALSLLEPVLAEVIEFPAIGPLQPEAA